jgi:glycosyltransferase involved in cell wall biosynthesis
MTNGGTNEMQDAPLVSVVMPAYNTSLYIKEAVESVFKQTFNDFELIVVNDGSPDTPQMEAELAPFMDRILYLKQSNRGSSGACNTAIRAARGRYIARLDSDDYWEPAYLEHQIRIMSADPSIDVLSPNARYFGDPRSKGQFCYDPKISKTEITFETFVRVRVPIFSGSTAKRDALMKVGLFDENLGAGEDFELWLRLLNHGYRIHYHLEPLVNYRRRPGSHTSKPIWMYSNFVKLLDKVEADYELSPTDLQAVRDQRANVKARLNLVTGKKAFFDSDFTAAIDSMKVSNEYFQSAKLSAIIAALRIAPRMLRYAYTLRDKLIFKTSTTFEG